MDQPAGSAYPPGDRGAGHGRPGVSHRRALFVGLSVSVLAHVAALLIYPVLMRRDEGTPLPYRLPAVVRPSGGVTVLNVEEVPDAAGAERPATPVRLRPAETPAVRPSTPDVGDPGGPGLVAPGPSAAERLRPRVGDARLWSPLDPVLNELTIEQRLQLDLAWRIASWQDSLAAAAAAEGALTDWTRTDSQGRKWGISEGKLHLGDVTLPLPFNFGIPVGRRDEYNRRAWEWQEIQRGAAGGAVRDSWKDRAQAIRERRDRERAKIKPDTSGVRR